MPVYYALLKGNGEGCDYTIGCNMRWRRLRATTLDGAKAEALFPDGPTEASHCVGGEPRVAEITILEVCAEIDLRHDIAVARDEYRIAQEQTKIAEKRRTFERLKKELGE